MASAAAPGKEAPKCSCQAPITLSATREAAAHGHGNGHDHGGGGFSWVIRLALPGALFAVGMLVRYIFG
ncbi:MAG: hypothetical protein LIP18_08115 [Planctomycetes bacterium]|nr:hypothetical protein [Planctomycetota bacterium]